MTKNSKNSFLGVLTDGIAGAFLGLLLVFILGNFYSCFIFKYFHQSPNRVIAKIATDLRQLFGDVGACYEDQSECLQVDNPTVEQIKNAILELQRMEDHEAISIGMENCPYILLGTVNQKQYYQFSKSEISNIISDYNNENYDREVRLIILDKKTNKRIELDTLMIRVVAPTIINSISKKNYTTEKP